MISIEEEAKGTIDLLPEDFTTEEALTWIGSVLATEGNSSSVGRGREKQVTLPVFEAVLYRELVRQFGEPGLDLSGNIAIANITRLFLWNLNKKYNLGLSIPTMIDEEGILMYQDLEITLS